MKTIYTIIPFLLLGFLFSCKKKEPIPNDVVTLSDLSSEQSTLTPTVPLTPTINLTFWAKSTVYNSSGGSIYVYLDGSYAGEISSYFTATPSCGAFGALTLTATSGSHTYYAVTASQIYYGSSTSPRAINVTASCSTREVYP